MMAISGIMRGFIVVDFKLFRIYFGHKMKKDFRRLRYPTKIISRKYPNLAVTSGNTFASNPS